MTLLCLLACSIFEPDLPTPRPAPPRVAKAVDTGAPDPDGGLWQRVPERLLTDAQRAEIEALEAIGYVDGAEVAPTRSGVVTHVPGAVAPGLNLWTSGHAPEAYLMDAGGKVLHTWRKPWEEVFGAPPTEGQLRGTKYWRRVHLFENGDLLAIYEGQGLVKLDKDSNVVWKLHERIHHDLEVLEDGRIVTLSRVGKVLPRYSKHPLLEDFVLVVSPDGAVEKRVSLLEAVEKSEWAPWFHATKKKRGDLFHTNSAEVLDGSAAGVAPAFTKGRVLTSFRSFHTIAVLDLDTGELVWAAKGAWRRQHDPTVLPGGRLLLFDNLGGGRKASAVRELDLATMDEVWSYKGSEEDPFYSQFCGAAQRLPNGNTLVSDSWVGRVFETQPDGTIVWEFLNPHRAGDEEQFIAVVPEMLRLDPAFPVDWRP